MPATHPLDTRALRDAFGAFATGVTVITTRGPDGNDYGLTANSFNSVSLEPPLLLWSLGDKAKCFEAFQRASHYAVHILAADQQSVSNQFASKDGEKFSGLEIERGPTHIPMLRHFSVRFICEAANRFPGGDHVIHVGRIVDVIQASAEQPLLFYRGKYASLG